MVVEYILLEDKGTASYPASLSIDGKDLIVTFTGPYNLDKDTQSSIQQTQYILQATVSMDTCNPTIHETGIAFEAWFICCDPDYLIFTEE